MDKVILEYKLFLQQKNISKTSLKNYCVDARSFIQWYELYSQTHGNKLTYSLDSFFTAINKETIESYKLFLIDNQTPDKTINRRLSGVRKLLSFALINGYINHNPAREVSNVGSKGTQQVSVNNDNKQILDEFTTELNKEGVSNITIKNYKSDISHFLTFINQVV